MIATLVSIPQAPPPVTTCSHCGLPVPAGLIEADAEQQFCCAGCRTVYAVLHECSLEKYYAFRERDLAAGAGERGPAASTGKSYREYDDAAFLKMYATQAREGISQIDFYLEGVHCAACVWLVEKLPSVIAGVIEARLDFGKALVRVTWDPSHVALSRIARGLDSLGYAPHPARGVTSRSVRLRDERRQLVRIGVAGAAAGNEMLLGIALYTGMFATMDPAYTTLFRYLSALIGIVALAWPGAVFFRGAIAAIRTRTPHLDLPIALGLGAGGVAGLINTITGSGEIYFDSLSVLVFLLLVGRFLQYRRQGQADSAVELLFSLAPTSARKVTGEIATDVPIESLTAGDIVEVLASESFPVDGVITHGQTTVEESLLTGETLPREAIIGAPVHAGTINVSSPVRLKVITTGEQTRVGKMMRLVTECARRKAPIVQMADRIAGRFLIAVLALSVITFAAWKFAGSPHALDHAVAIMIVACPCALGLATPLAVTVAIGRAARRGILVKGGDTMERLATPGSLLLDKTGTLTTGKMALVSWTGHENAKAAVAAIERCATHPIARAIVSKIDAEVPHCTAAKNVVQSRNGIAGDVAGVHFEIGSSRYIVQRGINIPSWAAAECDRLVHGGITPVVISADEAVVAVGGVGDTIRPDVPAALASLRNAGWKLAILSGDHPAVVASVASILNIADARGGLLPEQKCDIVQEKMRAGETVVMVGDGVNDAAALAAAGVGIAVHGGAEASLSAARVYLNEPGLGAIVDLTRAARGVMRVIRRAMLASICYNALAVGLAIAGLINPLVAAILMPISSLTVLTLALAQPALKKGDRK